MSDFVSIIGFRNILIHGYNLVDDELVWNSIEINMPVLINELEGILKRI
ncbi:MAG: DUF86 domain-containing protein [Bacteroidales bacterium]|nr:DUF86 domain-containing protein [Bacteroidales bacterium]